ncbi:MAG: lipoate--protein ligase family protein, partial [Bacilli bacterium]
MFVKSAFFLDRIQDIRFFPYQHFTCPGEAFAFDECLSPIQSIPILRLWTVDRCMALGAQDTLSPYLTHAIEQLYQDEWDVFVRTSGGRAVGLTPNILNFSLLFPDDEQYSVEWYFEQGALLLVRILSHYGIGVQQGEVAKSMCQGSYDLHIEGRKVAGIALRKKRTCTIVHCYMAIELETESLHSIRRFYKDTQLPFEIDITKHTAVSLYTKNNRPQDFVDIINMLLDLANVRVQHGELNAVERGQLIMQSARLHERSQQLLTEQNKKSTFFHEV